MIETAGSFSSSQPLKPVESGWLSVTSTKAAASAGWSEGRTTQDFTVMVNEPKVTDWPTLTDSVEAWAFTLSNACSLATPAGSQILGKAGAGVGAGFFSASAPVGGCEPAVPCVSGEASGVANWAGGDAPGGVV